MNVYFRLDVYIIDYCYDSKLIILKGLDGALGQPGDAGTDGNPGNPGLPGNKGYPGYNGLPGRSGMRGRNGMPGERGTPTVREGLPGAKGTPGYGRSGLPGPRVSTLSHIIFIFLKLFMVVQLEC